MSGLAVLQRFYHHFLTSYSARQTEVMSFLSEQLDSLKPSLQYDTWITMVLFQKGLQDWLILQPVSTTGRRVPLWSVSEYQFQDTSSSQIWYIASLIVGIQYIKNLSCSTIARALYSKPNNVDCQHDLHAVEWLYQVSETTSGYSSISLPSGDYSAGKIKEIRMK